MDTLTTLQEKIAASVDQTITPPSVGSAEWELRRYYINRAIEEWAHAYDWSDLYHHTFLTVSSDNQATISLASLFRKAGSFPIYYNGTDPNGEAWEEIQPNEVHKKDTTDQFYYILGGRSTGFNMIWNPGSLPSGASIAFDYFSYPLSLVSPADQPELSDPEYLVDRATAYIFETRNDPRFQTMEQKARERLLLMIDNENVKSRAYRNNIETPEKQFFSFRIGRD